MSTTTQRDLTSLQSHEMTLEEFASQVQVVALTNHGRRWDVRLPGRDSCFSDASTAEGAIQDAHRSAVNNALFFNSPAAEGMSHKCSMPPAHVLAQYPDVAAKFPDVVA